jgi:hypothetical protein
MKADNVEASFLAAQEHPGDAQGISKCSQHCSLHRLQYVQLVLGLASMEEKLVHTYLWVIPRQHSLSNLESFLEQNQSIFMAS